MILMRLLPKRFRSKRKRPMSAAELRLFKDRTAFAILEIAFLLFLLKTAADWLQTSPFIRSLQF